MEQQVRDTYDLWCAQATEDEDLVRELADIAKLADIAQRDEAMTDRFYRELTFGTGGLRGVLGAGSNRMNIYTVRRATQGLARYLNARYDTAAVAVAFDSRIKSDAFARAAACTLAANGITVYLHPTLQPTPVLSYTVRQLHCQAGIMVTASHNPAKYNGYKCYGSDGCQMTDTDAGEVMTCIQDIDAFRDVRVMDYEAAVAEGRIRIVENTLVEQFLARVEQEQVHPGICRTSPLHVVYTPLNGTGNLPVREILRRIGVRVSVVPVQELPDGHFPTAPYPNPEIRQAFACALELAETLHPDLLLATDPDCDRVGIAVKEGAGYTLMSGNEVGCLLLDYLLSAKSAAGTLPAKAVVVKTIVTSDLAQRIAEKYGCELIEVLTGFKYIGEQILRLEQEGHSERYVFGFEESYGYLSGTYVRDKDAVVASMLICEMAAWYAAQGQTLLEVLTGLYASYGVYRHTQVNAAFEGAQGMAAMSALMTRLREHPPTAIAGIPVVTFADYETSRTQNLVTGTVTDITLPRSNVLSFTLEGQAGVVVRPSGTEPKIKAYITATGRDAAAAEAMTQRLTAAAQALLQLSCE